jgi:WD40 repeat protein
MPTTWSPDDERPPEPEPAGPARYDVGERLGAGGVGEVCVATDRVLRREVAVKRLLKPSADAVARFVGEAQVTAQLDHPNIVPVYDLGVDDEGRRFLAMKRVGGRSVRAWIDSGEPWPLAARLEVFCKVCDAMAFAHARGVLHRDIKPDNVMVGDFGEVLLMDWGLARPIHGGDAPLPVDRFEGGAAQTREGQIAGSPAYMAPEQARGDLDALDARTDVYGLGALLYELITGVPPYRGDAAAVLAAVREGRFNPPSTATVVPAELDAIVCKAMAHRPADRYPSVSALREDVDAWTVHLPLPHVGTTLRARAAKWVVRHAGAVRGAAIVAGIALSVAIGGVYRYAVDVGVERDRAFDSAKRAIEAEREARRQLLAARVALADSRSRAGDGSGAGAALREADAISGDLGEDRRALDWALSGHARVSPGPVADCALGVDAVLALAVAPEGSEFALFAADGRLLRVAVDDCRVVETVQVEPGVRAALGFDAAGPYGVMVRAASVTRVRGGKAADVPRPDADAAHRAWVDGDAAVVAFADGQTWRFPMDGGSPSRAVGHATPGAVWWPVGDASLAVSLPNGREVGGVWDATGRPIATGVGVTGVAISPDRRFAALSTASEHEVYDVARGVALWSHGGVPTAEVRLVGADLLVAGRFDGAFDVERRDDGAMVRQIEADADGVARVAAWSEDGRIAAVARAGGRVHVYLMPRRTTAPLYVGFEQLAHGVATSHDTTRLAVAGDDGRVAVIDRATGVVLRERADLGASVRTVRFSPDDEALVLGVRSGEVAVWRYDDDTLSRWSLGGRSPAVDWIDARTLVAVNTEGMASRIDVVGDTVTPLGKVLSTSVWGGETLPGTRQFAVNGNSQNSASEVIVLDADTGAVVHRRPVATSRYRIAVSPDGKRVASGGHNGVVDVWDLDGGAVASWRADGGPTLGVAWSPDGRLVASTGFDGDVDLWDAATGALLRSIPIHQGPGTSVAFTADGAALLTTGPAGASLFPLNAHTVHDAAVRALSGPVAGRAAALAALGWWERVPAALRAAEAAGEQPDPRLREQAARLGFR